MKYLDPDVWGPHYWFFLHTLSMNYPKNPNAVTKKKFYEMIQNFYLFIPVESISNNFNRLIVKYPVAPYLDNKESLIKWVHFIHNKVNENLEKPHISIEEFYTNYYEQYKSKNTKLMSYYKIKQKIIYLSVLFILFAIIYYFYDK